MTESNTIKLKNLGNADPAGWNSGMQREEGIFIPFDQRGFTFSCRPDIACFNSCCARLRLLLTPYDILRLKNRLGISSDVFLERYTDTVKVDYSPFPMVRLRMKKEDGQHCPFLSEQGCTVYEDRPGACRLYPLGRAAISSGDGTISEKFFIVKESHCLGLGENRHWGLEKWMDHEGVTEYNEVNDEWLKIVTSRGLRGRGEALDKKLQMFFMASYNLDRLRAFFFKSSFFTHFKVSETRWQALKEDDLELLRFGFLWQRFSLLGEKTLTPAKA